MKHKWIRITLYGYFLLFMAACNQIGTPASPGAESNNVQMTQPSAQPSPSSNIASLIEKARKDLAQRLTINVEDINVLEARDVVWPDASLGCPQPDMIYAQIEVEGLLIRLGVGREMYFYHSGGGDDPFLCESTSQILPKSTPKYDEFVPPPDSEID
jgi:hypothetical protein